MADQKAGSFVYRNIELHPEGGGSVLFGYFSSTPTKEDFVAAGAVLDGVSPDVPVQIQTKLADLAGLQRWFLGSEGADNVESQCTTGFPD